MKKILMIALIAFIAAACSSEDATVTGTATAGTTVSGITVKLYNEDYGVVSETQTDASGNFSFSGLDEGNYYIGATVTIDGVVWDTGNIPKAFFVSGDIVKTVTLTLSKKS